MICHTMYIIPRNHIGICIWKLTPATSNCGSRRLCTALYFTLASSSYFTEWRSFNWAILIVWKNKTRVFCFSSTLTGPDLIFGLVWWEWEVHIWVTLIVALYFTYLLHLACISLGWIKPLLLAFITSLTITRSLTLWTALSTHTHVLILWQRK